MLKIKHIVKPNDLEEAYDILISKNKSKIIGGGAYLRLSRLNLATAIDIDSLNLNFVNDTKEYIEIGSMTTLRTLEIHKAFIENFNGIISKCVKNIVGIQLRNIATIGGTVYSRYGFSDVITALLSLNTTLVFYNLGEISLEDYLKLEKLPRDILLKIKIKKENRKASFQAMRNSPSDYAILNCALSFDGKNYKVVIGASPYKATLALKTMKLLNNGENIDTALDYLLDDIKCGSNLRGSKEYREHLSKVLVKRAYEEVFENDN